MIQDQQRASQEAAALGDDITSLVSRRFVRLRWREQILGIQGKMMQYRDGISCNINIFNTGVRAMAMKIDDWMY